MLLSLAIAAGALAAAALVNEANGKPPPDMLRMAARMKPGAVLVEARDARGVPLGWCIVHDTGFATNFDPSRLDSVPEMERPWSRKE